MKSVRSHNEGDDVGYIRVTQFNEQTTDGLKKAIADLTSQLGADKVKGFVVDLRNNPGGLLDQAISVSDAFLDKGEIVSTRGRNAEETQRFNARPGDLTKGKPVIVLINGGSASASEIVAGALQDHKRATLVGTRSFGKGSVQTIIPLGAGNGALRLTTARYFTPSGRSIQAKGIEPDIKVLQEVPKAISDLAGQLGADKIKGFVIDLRNNPGGLLDQAISGVGCVLRTSGEIVSTRGRDAEETQRFNARPGDLTKGKPVIVLINGGSASASEIVAGAASGPQAGDARRYSLVRQGLGADHHPAWRG